MTKQETIEELIKLEFAHGANQLGVIMRCAIVYLRHPEEIEPECTNDSMIMESFEPCANSQHDFMIATDTTAVCKKCGIWTEKPEVCMNIQIQKLQEAESCQK